MLKLSKWAKLLAKIPSCTKTFFLTTFWTPSFLNSRNWCPSFLNLVSVKLASSLVSSKQSLLIFDVETISLNLILWPISSQCFNYGETMTCIFTWNVTLPQMFFTHFPSKNQSPGFSMSGTTAWYGLSSLCEDYQLYDCQGYDFLNWNKPFKLDSKSYSLVWFEFSLREKCPNTKFFLVLIFLYLDWIQKYTDQKKLGIRTLHAVSVFENAD